MLKQLSCLIAALLFTTTVHAEKATGGPQGGRLLEAVGLKAEFLVGPDHNVTLTFYNQKMEKQAVTTQSAVMIAEAPSGKKKIELREKDGQLVSAEPLPEGHGYTVVMQIKNDPESKLVNFRIPLETDICKGCGRAEYACTCDE